MPMINPGLIAAIHNALSETGEASPGGLVLNALIHAWYEGHIDGESARRLPARATSQAFAAIAEDAFPSPPYPDRKSRELASILKESKERFDLETQAPGAVVYAAGLGWAAGYREGQACHGCSYRGPEPEFAEILRAGGVPLDFPRGRGPFAVDAAETRPNVAVADALQFALKALGHNLRAARKHAGLTQLALAKRMKKTLATVRGAESGKVRVPASYVAEVLKVCGLPRGWKVPSRSRR